MDEKLMSEYGQAILDLEIAQGRVNHLKMIISEELKKTNVKKNNGLVDKKNVR